MWINITQARTQLFRLIDLAVNGEEVVIFKSGQPVARLVSFSAKRVPRRPGTMRGKIKIKKNFDAPLPKHWFSLFGT